VLIVSTPPPLFVVRRRPPAKGVSRKGDPWFHSSMLQLPVSGGRESSSRQLSGLQTRQRGAPKKEGTENTQNYFGEGVLLKHHHSRCLLRGSTPRQRRPTAAATAISQVPVAPPPTSAKQNIRAPALQQTTGQSVQAPLVNSEPLDNMLRAVTVVQQIMTEVSGAQSQEDSGHHKNCLKTYEPKWPLEFIGPSKS
jgi:hypothetical protein